MFIQVDDSEQLIEIWLTNADQEDSSIELKSLYEAYNQKGYLVAVYKSGKGSLLELTKDLVCHNL